MTISSMQVENCIVVFATGNDENEDLQQ